MRPPFHFPAVLPVIFSAAMHFLHKKQALVPNMEKILKKIS